MRWFIILLWGMVYWPGVLTAQTYEEYIEKSYQYLDRGELFAAEESLRAAMRLEPGNPNNYALLTNLGTIQRRQGKWEDAVFSYTAALGRHPDNETILDNRASLYAEMGEADKAINDYSLLLLQNPINEDALYRRGILYLGKKDFIRAEQDFDRMLEVNEKTVFGRLGHAVLEKMRGNYGESERIYNYLIDQLPHNRMLYEGRADLYFMMGKNGRALTDINRVFAEAAEPAAAMYVLRGKIKLSLYEREPARKDFLKAKEMGYNREIIDELLRMAR
ncbi:MAG: tetratricopeptide repeat protein [Tannerellaceae bacterium]|jgi:tetratricopeptide (TPR) repeat protein|nr:tetratricopeptide repeat protein [Tannerellaceae bacterium]